MYQKKDSKQKFKTIVRVLVGGFALVVLVAIAFAGGDDQPAETSAGKSVTASNLDENQDKVTLSAEGRLSYIGFDKEGGIRGALRTLAVVFQKNIVPSPGVDGPLTFTRLYDVTFEEAMDAVLGSSLKYKQKGQLIKVYTREEYKKVMDDRDRMINKVFTLYYITAEEASRLISPVLSGAAKMENSSPAEKEISGGSTSSAGSSITSGGGGDSMALHDIIVVYDFPENIAKAEEIIRTIDVRPKQVLVEATILSVLLTEGMELGVDLSLAAGISLTGTDSTSDLVSGDTVNRGTAATTPIRQIGQDIATGTPIETSGFATVGGNGLRLGITSGDVAAFITALETITDTTVLANPKILAVNKQEGSVLIGTNLGYRSSTTISTAGVASEGEVKFLQTGTQLVFRPYIGNDGYIRMDIYPKDSSATLNADGVPTEKTTQLKTNILVRDGETIVIGGLFRDVVTTTRSQIPLLGDIPIIGALFRKTVDTNQREEVIILLTPHIIEKAGQTDGEARLADINRRRHGASKGLQKIGRTRLTEDHYAKAEQYYNDGDSEAALREVDLALKLRSTYLEVLQLREKIISETKPQSMEEQKTLQTELQLVSGATPAENHYAKAVRYYTNGDNATALSELEQALRLHPAYLEAIRLKEKIVSDTNS